MNNVVNDGELCHYGVKGMKWGVRRYQNKDGTLTAAGKKRARKELRDDNKTAYEFGKKATILGRAAAKSLNRTIRYENRLDKQYEKDPEGLSKRTRNMRMKWDASAETSRTLLKAYTESRTEAEKHCKSLIEKYGDEYVKNIKYKEVKLRKGEYSPPSMKVMNERTNNLSDYASAGAATVASAAFSSVMGAPITLIFFPKSTRSKASATEELHYTANLNSRRYK